MSENTILLRAFEMEDIRALHRWMNDPDAIALIGRVPVTYEQTVGQVEKKRRNGDLLLTVTDEENRLHGWVFLQNIEPEHGRAGIGILLAPESRGQGFGEQAMSLAMDIGFNQLRLNKIYLTTRGINERAIALYRKLGFQVEGLLRKHAFTDGQYYDTYYMGILAKEWRDRKTSDNGTGTGTRNGD